VKLHAAKTPRHSKRQSTVGSPDSTTRPSTPSCRQRPAGRESPCSPRAWLMRGIQRPMENQRRPRATVGSKNRVDGPCSSTGIPSPAQARLQCQLGRKTFRPASVQYYSYSVLLSVSAGVPYLPPPSESHSNTRPFSTDNPFAAIGTAYQPLPIVPT